MGADAAGRALREAAVRRLALLDSRGELSSEHVRLTASAVGVSERMVWRWVHRARVRAEPPQRGRFEIDDRLRVRLAYHRGNAAALHRELAEQARAAGSPAAPTVKTVQRAIRRDLTAGERAGLRRGERERRKFDVFLQRPPSHRNAAWEADHVEAPVEVEVDGRLVKPWVTWFVDACHNAICGTAVTPGFPSRESILAALRAAIVREEPYGPVGGLPALVRIDQGKDFLSNAVADALGAFAVRVVPLPGYTPHLKGTVETVNGAVERMLFAQLPRYTHAQTLASGAVADPDAPALTFEAFVAEVLAWVGWWNTAHEMDVLDGTTPVAAAVRAHWHDIPDRRRPQRHPMWWTAPTGLKLDRVARALADHLGSPVARGENASGWVSRLLVQQRVPVLILSDLGNLPIARREHNSLPRLLAYLVKSTSTLFVFVDPDAERVLFDVPAGIELASRTALLTIPRPELAKILPFPDQRAADR